MKNASAFDATDYLENEAVIAESRSAQRLTVRDSFRGVRVHLTSVPAPWL